MLLLLAIPVFVGNQACFGCHEKLAKSYSLTPMAKSSGPAGTVAEGSFRHAASGFHYEVDKGGLVRFSKSGSQGKRQLDYYIGSGTAGRSYLYQLDGFLFEAPITWYARTGAWEASPGYEADRTSRWNRAVEPSCLLCHASGVRARDDSQNAYADPPFEQNGVGCERCHGPGSLHVQGKGKMILPGRLDASRRDAVCAQCHLSGEARIVRAGRRLQDYRPGDRLADFAAYFVAEKSAGLQVNSHVEKLSQSVCKRSSGDRLWCGSCHDPHTVPAPAERAAWYRSRCLTCHATAECDRGFDCTSCHMPKNRAIDAGHGVFTDHSIPRVAARAATGAPAKAPAQGAADSWRLRGFSPDDAGDRELGLAYAEVGVRSGDPRQQREAIRLLTAAAPDAEVETRLADLEERAGDFERAAALYQSALRRNPGEIVALVNLGRLYGTAGSLDRAITLWRDALQRNPCLVEAGVNLQIALRAQKDAAGAEAVRRGQDGCVVE